MEQFLNNNPQVVVTFIIGVFTLLLTIWFSYSNLKITHLKMEKELFTEFNKRYDELNDSLALLDGISTIEQLKSTPSLIANKSMYNILITLTSVRSSTIGRKRKEYQPKSGSPGTAG